MGDGQGNDRFSCKGDGAMTTLPKIDTDFVDGDWPAIRDIFSRIVSGLTPQSLYDDGNERGTTDFINFVYQRAATIPATPTTNGIPTGWSDAPPAGSDPLWMTKSYQRSDGTLIGTWSTPVQQGSTGLITEFSINGSTSWHSDYATGDLYMRQKVEGGSFSDAIQVVGEGTSGIVDTTHIIANAVTATKINVTDLAAINVDAGTLTAGDITALTISADKMTVGTLLAARIVTATISGLTTNIPGSMTEEFDAISTLTGAGSGSVFEHVWDTLTLENAIQEVQFTGTVTDNTSGGGQLYFFINTTGDSTLWNSPIFTAAAFPNGAVISAKINPIAVGVSISGSFKIGLGIFKPNANTYGLNPGTAYYTDMLDKQLEK